MSCELIDKIEQVFEEKVRPKLSLHGGNIILEEQDGAVLKVRMTGACANCPSAQLTVQSLIAEEVMAVCPQIQDVILISGVSDTLLDQARQILSQKR